MQSEHPIRILLVEDNPGDIRLTIELFEEAKLLNKVDVAKDGDEAMAQLFREGAHADKPMPDLILLDLGLPGKTGHDLLAEIKKDSALGRIPVVVLTGSDGDADILKTYDLGASSYIIKPVSIEKLVEAIRSIDDLSLSIVKRASE